ncbi:MAG: cytochrome c biogenesis protein CcsA [Nitrospirota bacterium]
MNNPLVMDTGLHWTAVIVYIIATIANTYGLIFQKERAARISYIIVIAGLIIHGIALLYRWNISGHGPYMAKYEVLSANAWIALFVFLVFTKIFPKIRPASIIVFPTVFLTTVLGLFFNPGVKKLPPTFKSIWLVLHITFYKISLGTLLIALTFSIFYVLRKKKENAWLQRLPDIDMLDMYAYRFTGFGFTFWSIGMLAGSIWAYQSWGRFWGWDPIETWSLITWIFLGIYLHLRRFFGWRAERAAYFLMICFLVSIIAYFFSSLVETSIHSEYFR